MRCIRLLAAVAAVAALAAPRGAVAAPPPEAQRLFRECVAAYDAGRFEAARVCFRRVHALYPTPMVLQNLALAEEQLGLLVEAYETYQRCLADRSGDLGDAGRAEVNAALAALRRRLAFVRVRTAVPRATLRLDGRDRGPLTAAAVAVLPGEHALGVKARGYLTWQTRLTLAAGETAEVEARLAPVASATPSAASQAAAAAPRGAVAAPEADRESRPGRSGAWLAAGAAVALLGAAGGCTAAAVSRAADANDLYEARDASGRPIPFADAAADFRAAQSDVGAYRGAAIGLSIGAALAAGTSAWLFLRAGGATRERTAKERAASRVRLAPAVGPGVAQLTLTLER